MTKLERQIEKELVDFFREEGIPPTVLFGDPVIEIDRLGGINLSLLAARIADI